MRTVVHQSNCCGVAGFANIGASEFARDVFAHFIYQCIVDARVRLLVLVLFALELRWQFIGLLYIREGFSKTIEIERGSGIPVLDFCAGFGGCVWDSKR